MHTIRKAVIEDIPVIISLAQATWFKTYQDIISKAQIDYMFGEMYTPESVHYQMTFLQHTFLLLTEDGKAAGYASYGKLTEPENTHKLHKLYILHEVQGKKYGEKLIREVERLAKEEGSNTLLLNVNIHNKAKGFYERLGYEIIEQVDIPIGEYWMNDYVMRIAL